MTVFEAARELGRLITETEQAAAHNAAQEKYLTDEGAVKVIQKYEQFQRDIEKKMQAGEMTQEQFVEATTELKRLGTEVKSHPIAGAYVEASNNFNKLLNQVFHIVQSAAWGQDLPECDCGEGCGDDCGCEGNGCSCGHCH